jgi:hypothetical protein
MTEQTIEFLKSSRKRRIVAFLIDHFVMTFLMVTMVFIAHPNFMNEMSKIGATMLPIMIFGFVLYFAKDSIKGVSVGKWIMGIMVRDENNQNEIPSFSFSASVSWSVWPDDDPAWESFFNGTYAALMDTWRDGGEKIIHYRKKDNV